ncbi:hypothetical protein NPIL_410511 [Nephila pilipes]|uniref:Uncharacterized protein n=1 Tax=Nephila pilipes TaxID=299642 RepID=A0A8X6PP72_NEPPI|nr:hypothetical protein NPIL_410511 [Nephila pilipes]
MLRKGRPLVKNFMGSLLPLSNSKLACPEGISDNSVLTPMKSNGHFSITHPKSQPVDVGTIQPFPLSILKKTTFANSIKSRVTFSNSRPFTHNRVKQ